MWVPGQIKTWIVMLHGSSASVFEAANPGRALTRIHQFGNVGDAPVDDAQLDAEIAAWLETAVNTRTFDRLMLVGSAKQLQQLRAAFSPAAEARLAAMRVDDLDAVPPDEMRRHVPEATWI